jgi:hypothetical protein
MVDKKPRITFYQALLVGTILFSLATAFQLFRSPYDAGILFRSRRWMAGLGLGTLILIVEFGLLFASQTRWQTIIERRFEAGLQRLQRMGMINLLIFGLAIGTFAFLVLDLASGTLGNNLLRLFSFWVLSLLGALLLRGAGWQMSWFGALATSLLTVAFFYRLLAYLPDLSTHPLSLGWSEASRYYYASLYFSDRIYGISVPPTVLHPSRYLMQSIPFLIPESSLWLHRLWQVLLWLVTTATASIVLVRWLKIDHRFKRWALFTWAFLFLLVGPVYYHLIVPLIIILWGYDRQRTWQTLLVVLVASAWAGISRINWFPVPGMLAASLFILQEPVNERSFWHYWSKPVLWTAIGTGIAFAAQAAYAVFSGNPPELFTSSLTSDLLWYRLLPNPTYPEGVLLSALIVILPMLALILTRLKGYWKRIHPLRLLGLATILLVLLVGGLVVSTKIGGGSNLHNLDAFLSLFMVVTAAAVFDRIAWERISDQDRSEADQSLAIYQTPTRQAWLMLTILIPVYTAVLFGAPYRMPNQADTQDALTKIERFIDRLDPNREEVLFIDERQLVTFQTIKAVKLVPDYEKVFLMEMAMAGNPDYLGRFHSDLKNHRFSVIISEPLFITTKGPSEPFGEENDAWVEQVARPVLCYYESARFLRATSLQILVPKKEPGPGCP